MFGLFKRQDHRIAIKNEFEELVQQIRSVEPAKQAMVGRGIFMAQTSFDKIYTKASYRAAPLAERRAFIDNIRQRENVINQQNGPISLCSIGFALFNRWLAAAAMADAELLQQFEPELAHFKQLGDSFASEGD